MYERLRHWRRTVATEQDVPAYVVFTDATLAALAERKPTSSAELAAIPGIGRLTVDAILRRDYPVIQGVILIFSVIYVLVNLLVDLSYKLFDPRIQY